MLRELALEALRLAERDPVSLVAALEAHGLTAEQLAAAAARCQSDQASTPDLQALLRVRWRLERTRHFLI
mgnify:CR=1 FL=1